MKHFFNLLLMDFTLLKRNNIFLISALVTAVYLVLFQGFKSFGNLDKVLVLLIFNDPALLGFLFIAVMVLFEKNENTLQALVTTPMKEEAYILAKSFSLTLLALVLCFVMAFAAHGFHFNYLHFAAATFFTTTIFSLISFIVVSGVDNFNQYILKSVGLLILLATPFLAYFGLLDKRFFLILPTQPAIDLFNASFEDTSARVLIYAYTALFFWTIILYYFSLKSFKRNIRK